MRRQLCRVCTAICEGPYCEKHKINNPRANKRPDKCYVSGPWPTYSEYLRARNAQCQKLTNGVQCMNPSVLVHHLLSPRTHPDLLLVASNCVCLCRERDPKTGLSHHPNTEGTPDWKLGVDYVPTNS